MNTILQRELAPNPAPKPFTQLKLKLKLKSLACEARIIRKQELKMRGENWGPESCIFHNHRTAKLRPEARATHLAYGYLKGLRYSQLESSCRTPPPKGRVLNIVCRYSTPEYHRGLKYWWST